MPCVPYHLASDQWYERAPLYPSAMTLQDEKERLKGQVAAASQGTTANSAQLQDKHTFIASLQVCYASTTPTQCFYLVPLKSLCLSCCSPLHNLADSLHGIVLHVSLLACLNRPHPDSAVHYTVRMTRLKSVALPLAVNHLLCCSLLYAFQAKLGPIRSTSHGPSSKWKQI